MLSLCYQHPVRYNMLISDSCSVSCPGLPQPTTRVPILARVRPRVLLESHQRHQGALPIHRILTLLLSYRIDPVTMHPRACCSHPQSDQRGGAGLSNTGLSCWWKRGCQVFKLTLHTGHCANRDSRRETAVSRSLTLVKSTTEPLQ